MAYLNSLSDNYVVKVRYFQTYPNIMKHSLIYQKYSDKGKNTIIMGGSTKKTSRYSYTRFIYILVVS